MRVNMSRWLVAVASVASVASVAIIGCSTTDSEDERYGSGFIVVSEGSWDTDHMTPYPFTVPEGEISCGFHPAFGREVHFEPKGYTDESYVGTPLNKSAVDALKQSNLTSNVSYGIKEGADLSEAIQIGLKVCDEQNDMLANR
ncbi:hypothetical protein [Psychrobacter urativorans]|uniref:hypothetical protein n=1 Tax=Psychrobacter urativorans TaxID=45610 RepID=UPI001D10F642|nr:hypothetical protein [Psychrobacter urativorans]